MAFVTIPDINNSPVMVNTDKIACITIEPDGVITLHMSSEFDIQTPIPVQTSTEWAG